MFTISCTDLGQKCNYIATGTTETEVLEDMKEHEKSAHNLTEKQFNKMKEKIEDKIQEIKEDLDENILDLDEDIDLEDTDY